MARSRRRTQRNGRERGTQVSTGAHAETSPLARATATETKEGRKRKLERKGRGWDDGE